MQDKKEKIMKYLDENEKVILENIISILDSDNLLKFTFFAVGIRELIRIFIQRNIEANSDEEDIKNCIWYKKYKQIEDGKEIITRKQRLLYIVFGGLNLQEVKSNLNINPDEVAKKITDKTNVLNKYTHFNEILSNIENENIAEEILDSFLDFLISMDEFKKDFSSRYEDYIMNKYENEIVNIFYDEIDSRATHFEETYLEIENIELNKLTSEYVQMQINLNLYVKHQMGSDYDNRIGDGLRFEEKYKILGKTKIQCDEVFSYKELDIDIKWLGEDIYES